MTQLTPDQIRARLSELDARFPFPPRETERLAWRKWITQFAPKNRVGAEIGVFRGRFSEVLLESLTPRRMYFIDPWTRLGTKFNLISWYTNMNELPTAVAAEEARLRVALYPATQSTVIEDYFPACAEQIPERLDWIYLDSSHDYEATQAELEGADRLLSAGGVILGDDWMANPTHQHHGVFRAVNEFLKRHPYEFVAAGPGFQWCIRRSTRYAGDATA